MNGVLISYELFHHGIRGQKWGVRNGPPYPLRKKKVVKYLNSGKLKLNLQMFAKIPEEKFIKYALDFEKLPNKARAFKEALGYTKENYKELIDNIDKNFNRDKLDDIMILLDLTDIEIKDFRHELSGITYDFNEKYNIDIKPIAKSNAHFKKWLSVYPFYTNVDREGVVLYGTA